MGARERIRIVYDGECPLCRRARVWLAARDKHDAFDFLPCGSDEQRERAPDVDEAACREAMHVVTASGDIHAGANAIGEILPYLPAPWPQFAGVLRLPGVRAFAPKAYAWVARHRLGLSSMLPGHSCDAEKRKCAEEEEREE